MREKMLGTGVVPDIVVRVQRTPGYPCAQNAPAPLRGGTGAHPGADAYVGIDTESRAHVRTCNHANIHAGAHTLAYPHPGTDTYPGANTNANPQPNAHPDAKTAAHPCARTGSV